MKKTILILAVCASLFYGCKKTDEVRPSISPSEKQMMTGGTRSIRMEIECAYPFTPNIDVTLNTGFPIQPDSISSWVHEMPGNNKYKKTYYYTQSGGFPTHDSIVTVYTKCLACSNTSYKVNYKITPYLYWNTILSNDSAFWQNDTVRWSKIIP